MKLSEPPLISWEMMCYKIIYFNFWNVWLINLTTWNFKMQAKLQFLDHQIVTSCIAIVKVVFLLFIWKEMTWKIPNLENLEFYTCTLWAHNAKFLIMAYRGNSWVPNDCILVGINETKWTTFDLFHLFLPECSYLAPMGSSCKP